MLGLFFFRNWRNHNFLILLPSKFCAPPSHFWLVSPLSMRIKIKTKMWLLNLDLKIYFFSPFWDLEGPVITVLGSNMGLQIEQIFPDEEIFHFVLLYISPFEREYKCRHSAEHNFSRIYMYFYFLPNLEMLYWFHLSIWRCSLLKILP